MREAVAVYFKDGEKAKVEAWADKQRLSVSTAVRKLVLDDIERNSHDNDDE